MKVSQIGLISTRIKELDPLFPVQDMLLKTGQIDQFSSGIYAYGHIPFLVKKNVEKIISEVLTKYGCSELSLPVLQTEALWQESGRLDKYVKDGVMFRVKTDKANYCLAPTAEEAVVNYARTRLTSHKQLPATYFQIGLKFRNEIRTRGYLLRGKSFDMMDAYSFGKDENDLNREYENIKQAYLEIFQRLGLNVQPVGADSGDIGGHKSEEFMCLSAIGEDNILFDTKTGKAFNAELLEKPDYATYLKEVYGITDTTALVTRKAVELGHIFQLGEKYSQAMNATYVDEQGGQKPYVMGCYGIGVSRTVAMLYESSLVMNNGKFAGIALPASVAPYPLYIIPKFDDAAKAELANKIYQALQTDGVPVLYDDRADISIGVKIKDSKITGTPYTVVLGNSLDEGLVEVEDNRTGEKITVALDQFVDYCKSLCGSR